MPGFTQLLNRVDFKGDTTPEEVLEMTRPRFKDKVFIERMIGYENVMISQPCYRLHEEKLEEGYGYDFKYDEEWQRIQDRLKRADELEAENKRLRFHIKESASIRSGEE